MFIKEAFVNIWRPPVCSLIEKGFCIGYIRKGLILKRNDVALILATILKFRLSKLKKC